MTGWIIKNGTADDENAQGCILSSEGLTYTFRPSLQGDGFHTLELKTSVSFAVLPEDGTALIESILEETVDPIIAGYDAKLRDMVSPKLYMHCFRVSKIACAAAEHFGVSPEKAEIAGLLHDMAKENSREENIRLAEEAGIKLADFEKRDDLMLHAAAGAAAAESVFKIEDRDILNAIRYHSGRPAMTDLEKIVFLADNEDFKFRRGLSFGIDLQTEKDLDTALCKTFMNMNRFIVSKQMQVSPVTESTMNYVFTNLRGNLNSFEPGGDSGSSIPDELFDKMLGLSSERSLPLNSVKNIRQLGGCTAYGGRRIKQGLLVRSGRLSNMTEEDAKRLSDFGIRTIIDLRGNREIAESPDVNTEMFNWVHCPLAELKFSQYHNDIQEKFLLTPPGEEKAFYLSEYLSCIDMKELYMNNLKDERAIKNLCRIFELLCSEEGGFLFHCTSGKDRTGVVAALILTALGTPTEEIKEDYYVSALATFAETESFAQCLRKQNASASLIDEMRYFNGIGVNIAESVYESVVSEYGSAEKYLTDMLISEEKIEILRNKFAE